MIRKASLALALASFGSSPTTSEAFAPSSFKALLPSHHSATMTTTTTTRLSSSTEAELSTKEYAQLDERTGKPTGIAFLPAETIALAEKGSPVEKIKLQKDGTSAFVDVYEYARKIREGEMTWKEVEAADLDSVCCCSCCFSEWHNSSGELC